MLIYVERLCLADGEPVILERRHLVAGLCGNPGRRDLGGSFTNGFGRVGVKVTGTSSAFVPYTSRNPERKSFTGTPRSPCCNGAAVTCRRPDLG